VTLTGQNLTDLTGVLVGEVPALFTVLSSTSAKLTVPRQATSQKIRAVSAGGPAFSLTAFGVTRPSPSAVFASAALTTDGTTALNAGDFSAPAVTDVDGDGLLDLLVGTFGGNVRRYEQAAANSDRFTDLSLLTTDGTALITTGNYGIPAVTDIDGNGRLDLLVSNGFGNVQRYEQTAPNGGNFAGRGNLTTDNGAVLDVGDFAGLAVTDLDSDGLTDLLVSNNAGNVQRYEQTGTNSSSFVSVAPLTDAGGTPLALGNLNLTMTDLDSDGLLDMLVGRSSGVPQRFEQAAPGANSFTPLGNLTTNGTDAISAGSYAKPAITDIDGDGLLDLLLGNLAGTILRYEQVPVPTLTALSTAAELPGQPVTITGTGFASGSMVRFGGVAAASVSYTSPTSLTAVVPVGAPAGSVALTVGSYDVASPTAASPAFEVLQVYRSTAPSGCLSTAPLTIDGTGGAGTWRYLRLPGAGGAVVAAIEDTRNLGTVSAQVLALGTGTSAAVRDDGRGRLYLDRNFALTATNKSFPGQSVRVRFFGLSSEQTRLQAVDSRATLAGLNLSQYSGPNEDCDLTNNGTPTDLRVLPAPATMLSGADWFVAEANVADHFSEFYLTGSSAPLPVELTAFTATAAGPAAVRLAWATASEKNSASFEVERSLNGKAFARVGTLAAAGSSATPRRYGLLDGKLPIGATLLYYRLRQVDLDGTFSYSPVRTVALTGAAAGLALFPNPTHGAATLTGAQPGAVVTVLDALGRQVLTAPADAAGTAVLALPAGLASGVYVVRTGSQALRLTVE
jgi:uncharacterized protein (DUF2141 family)